MRFWNTGQRIRLEFGPKGPFRHQAFVLWKTKFWFSWVVFKPFVLFIIWHLRRKRLVLGTHSWSYTLNQSREYVYISSPKCTTYVCEWKSGFGDIMYLNFSNWLYNHVDFEYNVIECSIGITQSEIQRIDELPQHTL